MLLLTALFAGGLTAGYLLWEKPDAVVAEVPKEKNPVTPPADPKPDESPKHEEEPRPKEETPASFVDQQGPLARLEWGAHLTVPPRAAPGSYISTGMASWASSSTT